MSSRPFVILLKELTLWLYWRFPCIRPMISIFWTIHISTIININTIAAICFLLNLCKLKYLPILDALDQSIVHGVNKPTTWRWYLRKHCSHAFNQFKINIAAEWRRVRLNVITPLPALFSVSLYTWTKGNIPFTLQIFLAPITTASSIQVIP